MKSYGLQQKEITLIILRLNRSVPEDTDSESRVKTRNLNFVNGLGDSNTHSQV